jgi:hypothetical protein
MATFTASGTTYDLMLLTTGGKTYEYPYSNTKYSSVARNKTSVDSGEFIPGVYRVNPYSVSEEQFEKTDGEFHTVYTNYWGEVYDVTTTGDLFFYPLSTQNGLFPNVDLDNIKDRAIQRAYAKLSKPDLAMGENIGELKETLNMLRHPLNSLKKFLFKDNHLNMRKLKRLIAFSRTGMWEGARTASEAAKAAADTWLEFRYGFRPLVGTVQDVIKKVNEVDMRGFSPLTIRSVRASNKTENVVVGSEFLFACSSKITGYATPTWSTTATSFASVQYRQTRPNTLMEDLGLTAPYLPETAWELTRLSFVWDWLISIGPWLQSMRVKPHIQVLGNTLGVKVEKVLTITATGRFYLEAADVRKPIAGEGIWSKREYTRVVDYNLPLTPLLTGGDIIDLFRSIDALALITQQLLHWR